MLLQAHCHKSSHIPYGQKFYLEFFNNLIIFTPTVKLISINICFLYLIIVQLKSVIRIFKMQFKGYYVNLFLSLFLSIQYVFRFNYHVKNRITGEVKSSWVL